ASPAWNRSTISRSIEGESMSHATRRATFHSLEVAKVRRLTEESIEVTFAVPDHLRSAYQYVAGQYLALRTEVAGRPVRRSYSICRPPRDGRISVAIKRDFGGVFSTWANDSLCAGDRIEVMTPQGAFTSDLAGRGARAYHHPRPRGAPQ